MSNKPNLDGYVDVAERITEFRGKHPDGSLQPVDPARPFEVVTIGEDTFVVVVAAAYRAPDDPRPGIGQAAEPYPGKTPYTRGSELQNAETSAWGRAIVAALAADTRRGVASADEVHNRAVDRAADQESADPQMTAAVLAEATAAGVDEDAVRSAAAQRYGRELEQLSPQTLRDLWRHYHSLATAQPSTQPPAPTDPGPVSEDPGNGNGPQNRSQPAEDEPEPITGRQLTKLHVIFAELRITERSAQHTALSKLTGREITTSRALTKDEGTAAIDTLSALLTNEDPPAAAAAILFDDSEQTS